MRKLIALKSMRYPRNADGKQYEPGDEFEALSDRDVKALTLIRAAKEAAEQPAVIPTARVMRRDMEAKESETPTPEASPSRYARRDMRAKED